MMNTLTRRRDAAKRLPPMACGHRDPLDCHQRANQFDPCSRACWSWGLPEIQHYADTIGRCPCGGRDGR